MTTRILLTAGGTVEGIDDVRLYEEHSLVSGDPLYSIRRDDITNISSGKFLVEWADGFLRHSRPGNDFEIYLLGRRELAKSLSRERTDIRTTPFVSYRDLKNAIEDAIPAFKPDIIMMGAAVSDYSPIPHEGKISSDADEIVLRLKRNPKLLDKLRAAAGDHCLIVGFKLLSRVSHKQLVSVAQHQVERCNIDLTIANDASKIDWNTGFHPISIVDASGEIASVEGLRASVVDQAIPTLLKALAAKRVV